MDRPSGSLLKILANGEVIYDAVKESEGDSKWRDANRKLEKFFTFYDGTQTAPDSAIVAREGITRTPTYEGFPYIAFHSYNCEQYGNRIPSIEVIVYAPVGPNANNITYGSPGYGISVYSLDISGTNKLGVAKTVRVNNIQGPILGLKIVYSQTTYSEDTGTINVITSNNTLIPTNMTGLEWGKAYYAVSGGYKQTGVIASVSIRNYIIGGVTVVTNFPSTNIPNFSPNNLSIKISTTQPQRVRDLLDDLIATANKDNPFLKAQLDTSGIPDDLKFIGYKTSGSFDALSVALEVAKTYSLFFTYENAIPALSRLTEPEYWELHESDFVSGETDAPYTIEYTDLRQTPKELILKYTNSEQDLQDDVVVSRISANEFDGGIVEESTAFSLNHASAKGLAQNQLAVIASRGIDYSFKLHPRRRDLKIGSLLYYPEFGNVVKCEEVKYGFDHTLQVKATVYNPILDFQLPDYAFNLNGSTTAFSSSSSVSSASVEGFVAPKNLPVFNSSNLDNSMYVGLIADSNYIGGEVRFSTDGGASFASAFNLRNPSSYGVLTTGFTTTVSHLVEDRENEPIVSMSYGQLYSLNNADYNNYVTLLLVNREIICYRSATLGVNGYTLKTIQRGLFGTEKYMENHAVGSQVFVLETINRIVDDLINVDRPRIAILVDADQIASDAIPVDATNNGESIRPYNPHIYSVKRLDSGDIKINWAPRDRLQPSLLNNYIAQTDPENYRLTIGNGVPITTINRVYLYTLAMQNTDGFTGNTLTLDLIHLGNQAINSRGQSRGYRIY
jgi:Putative phage tail protein